MNKCHICSKEFSRKSVLIRHIKIHTGARTKKSTMCGFCKKKISIKGNSTLHMRTFEGEKLFICDLCEKTFSQIDHLKIPNTDEKIFKCLICKETFHTNCEMTLHNSIHTGVKPYSCDTCEKSFKSKSNLNNHKRIHTGDYSCDTCEKVFRTTRELTVHERFHTGEKLYSCELCKKSFNSCSNLTTHNKSAGHIKKLESTKNIVPPSTSTSFIDCGEADVKLEIKEEILDEDPLCINIQAESVEVIIKEEIKEEEGIESEEFV